ncbi:GTP-binding protein HSR1-related protein [Clostridiales bacterium PH28_bin88]|nr:GTP-binding protein HSR1-related protein [Clostridiales bacterium PH28_bin88]
MPANLTPQYYAAEEAFKSATSLEEKISALEEMLAVIPKHKGTEKLQAEIKSRLAKLRKEGEKKKTASHFDPFMIPKEGAGQVWLIGFPNTGKSSLVGALTRAKVQVADYPFATSLPVAGMMPFENILIQLVDTPPVTAGEQPPGLAGALRRADAVLVVVDASDGDCPEQLEASLSFLITRKLIGPGGGKPGNPCIPCLVLANKADAGSSEENIEVMRELVPDAPEVIALSAKTGYNLELFKTRLFQLLDIIRIYTKAPGKDPDRTAPFVLKRGGTVLDLAYQVHRDFPERLKSARIWGSARFDGLPVPRDYVLADEDVVELNV